MSGFRRLFALLAGAVLTVVMALGWQGPSEVLAHGVVDQSLENYNGGLAPSAFPPVGQSFTPTLSTIVGIDVFLSTVNPQGAADITLRVRSTSIAGSILASETKTVPQDIPGPGAWIHFELPTVVTLTPGQQYVIEYLSTNFTHFWRYQAPGTYPGGTAIVEGNPSTSDFMFRTYGSEAAALKGDVDCNGTVNAADALKVLRHTAGLPVSQTEPCIDIGDPTA